LIESGDGVGPFGAKGVGEPSVNSVAPAIANAVYDAVGVRVRELPITAEKVFMALREKGK
jgi:CO/xanthine dehydrogenase Mo-binding subunit